MFSLVSSYIPNRARNTNTKLLSMSNSRIFALAIRFKVKELRREMREAEISKSIYSERGMFLLLTRFKNAAPLFKTIGIVFFVSFLSLVIKELGVIGQGIDYPVTIPAISSVLFLTLPILNNKAIGLIEKNGKAQLNVNSIGLMGRVVILFYALVFVGALLVLPVWSLVQLHPIYIQGWSVVLPIILVLFLQIVTTITFMNYFSAMSVKKEMTILLMRLSQIQQRIHDAELNQGTNKSSLGTITASYFESKPFDLSADDSLLVNFYSLIPNPVYLSRLRNKFVPPSVNH
jgi:hypothetical protein